MSTGTGIDTELAEFAAIAADLQRALNRHQPSNVSSNAVTISPGGGVALLVGVIAIVVMAIAGSIVFAVKVQRDADMREIEAANREIAALRSEIAGIREDVDIASAYDAQYQRRLSALEAQRK